jgi:chitodextrinase
VGDVRRSRRAAISAVLVALVVAGTAGPAFAVRLRTASNTLTLAAPTVSCTAPQAVNLSWTDNASTSTATYRVMSLPSGSKQADWIAGPWLGNVRSTRFAVANGSWQFAIEGQTTTTRDSNRRSITVNCAPADTTPPSVPTGVGATVASCSQINIGWQASTDNAGGSGLLKYNIYRTGASAATFTVNAPTITFNDTSVAQSSSYSYQVTAVDNAGNESAKSAVVGGTTPACTVADTTPPSVPTGLSLAGVTCTWMNVNFAASTDNPGGSGVKNYDVYRGGTYVGTTTASPYADHTVSGSTQYSYQVLARDNAGNTSALSAVATAYTPACVDSTPPSVPTGLSATPASCSQINVAWNTSTDNSGGSGIQNYSLYRNGSLLTTTAATSFADTNLAPSTNYSYAVLARDNSGNTSAQSAAIGATTTACADTTPPSVPTNFTAIPESCSENDEAWTASTDNLGGSGVQNYDVLRDGAAIATTTATSYKDLNLAASTTYSYQVRARDNAGNVSALTAVNTVTTLACPDTTPPSVPTGLSATAASCSQINVAWNASTDTGGSGLKGYNLFIDGSGTPTFVAAPTTSFNDTGLAGSSSHSFKASAVDNAGNQSAQSTAVNASTPACPDTTPPSVPTGVGASAPTCSSVNVSWNASTDSTGGSGVKNYDVFRNGALLTTTANTSISDTGLAASTNYSYTVAARDNANNVSVQSTAASATTPACSTATGAFVWQQMMAGQSTSDSASPTSTATDASGNVYVVGSFTGTVNFGAGSATASGTSSDAYLEMFSSTGVPQWVKTFTDAAGTSGNTQIATAVAADAAGNVFVTGYFAGTTDFGGGALVANSYDVFIAKYSANGTYAWAKSFGGSSFDEGVGLATDSGGNVVLLGKYADTIDFGGGPMTTAGSWDAFLVKFTASGGLVWQKTMGGTGGDVPMGLALDSSGGPVVAGYFGGSSNFGGGNLTSAGSNDIFVARYNAAGGFVFAKNYGDTSDQRAYGVAVDNSGNIGLTGYIFGGVDFGNGAITNPNTGAGAPFVAELNANGVGAWSHAYPTTNTVGSLGEAVDFDSTGNLIVTGSMEEDLNLGCGTLVGGGTYDVFVAKYTPAGGCTWSHRYAFLWDEAGVGLSVDSANNIVVTGTFYQSENFGGGVMTTPGGQHGFVVKFTP